MAGTRSSLRKPPTNPAPRRAARRPRTARQDETVPDVFQNMLSEATASKAAEPDENNRPLKKRKTAQSQGRDNFAFPAKSISNPSSAAVSQSQSSRVAEPHDETDDEPPRILQTITDSEESDGSDMEWEDVLGQGNDDDDVSHDGDALPEVSDISITVGGEKAEGKTPVKQVRRRGITSVDKKRRLDIHKMHILCLLYHVHRRNVWCNNEKVQATLRKFPSPKTLSNLVPNPEFTQFQASRRFLDGIQELKILWSSRFSVTAMGMHKPRWVDADSEAQAFSAFDELDDPMDKRDFQKAATAMQGSQDVGAQLFCALLRGIGVDARLVCSLQCLPFASTAQVSTPQKTSSQKNVVVLDPYNTEVDVSPSKSTPAAKSRNPVSARPKRLSRLERALGERSVHHPGVAPKQKKNYHTAYPVYWVEVFNPAMQKWVPVDPLSTFTVDKPDKLEPPLNYSQNSLVYAIAFEDDSTAKDVTRRYAKAFNAKTRKFRVECTDGGVKWWKRALKPFRRVALLDRDQLEDAALARKEGAEGMPKNVQDFKDHPVYVLERHLKHNEVIHPMHQVGKVNVGSSMNPKMEPIYRRRDVHVVRSADKWYRLGRDVKGGEQPLKHAKPKRNAGRRSFTPTMDIDNGQEEIGAGLYALFQTELYVPPPVVRGRVPRNGFGNLDVYVPSMIPHGGAHVRRQHASKAARIVGIDYADAVTGFSFKGRHGTAVVQGVIVAQEYAEAVEAVLDGMEYAQEQADASNRSAEALRLWRRFCLGLRIAQRVNAIQIGGEEDHALNIQGEIERKDKQIAEAQVAGGFFPEGGGGAEHLPAPLSKAHESSGYEENLEGGFLSDENAGGGGFIAAENDGGGFIPEEHHIFGSSLLSQQQLRPRVDDFGGGFIPDHDDQDDGGGFIRTPQMDTLSLKSNGSAGGFIQTDGSADAGEAGEGEGDDESNPAIDSKSIELADQAMTAKHVLGDTPALSIAQGHSLDMDKEAEQDLSTELPQSAGEVDSIPTHGDRSPRSKSPSPVANEPSPSASSPSEVGSLPLEDPEDEDADPEWLVDAT
ncbi:hypothetical protein BCR34DRAFT_569790 [Clohesyomyces aquaticus]|uniref:Rad4 transglutaminase-like domain-domain-containing protein n=1 Tax=Clohesyomyces aquaticus TaxID=1231657 RepID=A0A1Y1ZE83_9PLEO|nr:hypothetical protein BCR34DRAFT_569790 [Clohesyomyces aquaticus]